MPVNGDVQATLKAAIAHHQAGRYPEAEGLYRQILARFPQHPDALHMLGLLAHHAGQNELAADLIGRAIRLAPNHAASYCNLGSVLTALGRYDEAVARCRQALALAPRFAEAHVNLGNVFQARGLLAEAAASYREALAARRDYAEAHYNLGNVLQAQGLAEQAAESFRRALRSRPGYAEAHNGLGIALQARGQADEAIVCYGRALALRPDFAEAHNNLGLALQGKGQLPEAIASLKQALALRPDYADAHNNLGAQYEAQGQHDLALACYQRALALKPDFPEVLNNLGNLHQAAGRLDESVASYQRAVALRPDYAEAHNNLGNVLQTQGLLDEAIRSHDRALALRPDFADARWSKSFALLLKGDYAAGWPLFEARWHVIGKSAAPPAPRPPLWLGDAPVAGRSLLLTHEQGLGDTLQMLRYVPLLAERGARVIIEVPPALAGIAATVPGLGALADAHTPACDLHCPFMSLPLAMRTTLATIPGEVPYLFAPEAARAAWRQRLGPAVRRRIGLVWSGSITHRNDVQRSIALERLLPLLAADAEFISLQKEYRQADRQLLDEDGRIRDCADLLGDFADTAGLIEQLDLLITVDTSVAHLAGALGKSVWLLLPFAPDYRWLLKRTDSPWYPTLRLFRQPAFGDWESVVRELSAALSPGNL